MLDVLPMTDALRASNGGRLVVADAPLELTALSEQAIERRSFGNLAQI